MFHYCRCTEFLGVGALNLSAEVCEGFRYLKPLSTVATMYPTLCCVFFGTQVILLQELFSTRYFCQEQKEEHFLLAESEGQSPLLDRFQGLAKELGVVSSCAHGCSFLRSS